MHIKGFNPKLGPAPKPRCSTETLEQLANTEAVIAMAEAQGDVLTMIQFMTAKEQLLKVAMEESSEWAARNTVTVS